MRISEFLSWQCVELVEILDPKYLSRMIDLLTNADLVLARRGIIQVTLPVASARTNLYCGDKEVEDGEQTHLTIIEILPSRLRVEKVHIPVL